MTYYDELAPRRRPWLIALPLVLVIVLGAAWTGLWFFAAGQAEARLNDWRAQQAKGGRDFTCASQSVGGFPFRIEVACAGVAAQLKDAQPPIAIKAQQILAVSQVWDPKFIIVEFTGPLTASDPNGAPYLTATWGLARASLRGTPDAPERASIAIDGLKLNGAQGPLFDAKRAEFHARMQYGSWPHNPAIDLVVKLVAATAPAVHAVAAQPLDADILAVLHGMKDLTPKPLPVWLREWQAAAGKLEIQSARLAQGEALAGASGALSLTPQGRLDGALQLTVAGVEKLLPAVVGQNIAPAMGALDRLAPGLSQRVPAIQPSMSAGLLTFLGQPAEIEGKKGAAIPLRFQNGSATFGPIPLGQVPPVF